MESHEITNEEVAAYVEAIADSRTERRVVAAALTDHSVRDRINLLRQADAALIAPSADFDHRAAYLQASMQEISQRIADKVLVRAEVGTRESVNGGWWRVAARVGETLAQMLHDTAYFVTVQRESLSLPCLAPAAAASDADLDIHRNMVLTPDGVRVEFQQMPGIGRRVRLIVDASSRLGSDEPPFDTAFVTVEENVPGATPDQHILIVGLNSTGRGLTDLTITSAPQYTVSEMPAPRGICHLVGVTLLRIHDLMQIHENKN